MELARFRWFGWRSQRRLRLRLSRNFFQAIGAMMIKARLINLPIFCLQSFTRVSGDYGLPRPGFSKTRPSLNYPSCLPLVPDGEVLCGLPAAAGLGHLRPPHVQERDDAAPGFEAQEMTHLFVVGRRAGAPDAPQSERVGG